MISRLFEMVIIKKSIIFSDKNAYDCFSYALEDDNKNY